MSFRFYGHPLSSYCWKALIALYETGASFTFENVDLSDPAGAARFREISPLGKMPALRDEARGLTLWESSIIIEHLDRVCTGPADLIPSDPDRAREVRFWDRFYDLYLQSPMQKAVADRLRPSESRDPFGVDLARRDLSAAYDFAEEALSDRPWAAGDDFSMADCAAAPALYYGNRIVALEPRHPRLAAYLERLQARPSFARVLEEAGPYLHFFPQDPGPG